VLQKQELKKKKDENFQIILI